MTLGEVLLTPTRIYAGGDPRPARGRSTRPASSCAASPTSPAAACPATCPRSLPDGLGARLDPARWPMPSVMRLFGALGGLEDDELRATFNGGLGMVVVVEPAAAATAIAALAAAGIEALARRRGRRRGRRAGRPALRRGLELGAPAQPGAAMTGRIAVGVSGAGIEPAGAWPRPPSAASCGGSIVLVFADRACPALDWAVEQGIETALVPAPNLSDDAGRAAWDAALAETLRAVEPDVDRPGRLHARPRAGGPGRLPRPDRQHPPGARCPAFPGAHAGRDALAHGVARHRRAPSTSSTRPSTAARSSLQEAVPVLPGDDEAALHGRIQAVEHRLLPRAVGLLLAGARRGPRRPGRDRRRRGRGRRCRSRAGRSCRSPTRPASAVRRGASSRSASSSSRPAARPRALRDGRAAGHRRGRRDRRSRRCSTAGSRRSTRASTPGSWPIAAGPTIARQLRRGGDRPVRARRGQPLSVRRGRRAAGDHLRRAGRGDRHRRTVAGPGRGQEPRLGRRRDVARPLRRRSSRPWPSRAACRPACGPRWPSRRSATPPPTTPGSPPTLPGRMAAAGIDLPDEPGLPGASDPYPADADDRPREGRDAALRREPAPAGRPLPAARARRRRPGRSRRARRRSRARRSATTTSSTRRRPRRSPGASAARPA